MAIRLDELMTKEQASEKDIVLAQIPTEPPKAKGVRLDSLLGGDDRPDQKVYFPDKNTTRGYPAYMNEDEMGYDAQVEIYGKPKGRFMLGVDMAVDVLKATGEGVIDFFPTTALKTAGGTMMMEGDLAEEIVPMKDEMTQALAGMPMAAVLRAVKGVGARFTDVDEKISASGREMALKADEWLKTRDFEGMSVAERFAYDIGGAGSSIFTSLALTWLTKNPNAATALFGQIAKSETYQRGIEAGKTPREAYEAAQQNFATEGALEYAGLEMFTKYLRGSKSVARGLIKAGSEFFQEAFQTLGSELSAKVGGFNERAWGDILKDMGYSGLIGFIAAGPGAAIQVAKENKSLKGKMMKEFNLTETEAEKVIEKFVPVLTEATAPTVQRALDTELSELQSQAEKQAGEKKIVEGEKGVMEDKAKEAEVDPITESARKYTSRQELYKDEAFRKLREDTEALKLKAQEEGGLAVREWREAQSRIEEIETAVIENEKRFATEAGEQRDLELRKQDPTVDKLSPKDEIMLEQEAKKYETFEEFVGFMRGSSTQYGKYAPKMRKFVTPTAKRVSDFEGIKPGKKVTIYRGIDTTEGRVRRGIFNGDFVTTDFDSALAYTDSPGNVVSKEVRARDLITEYPEEFNIKNPFAVGEEFIYMDSSKPIVKITNTQLRTAYDKAKAEAGGKVAEEEGDISFNVEEFDAVEEVKPDEQGRTAAEKRLDEIMDAKEKRAAAEAMLSEVVNLASEFKNRIKDKVYEGQKIPTYFRTNNEFAITIDEALDEARNIGWGVNFGNTSDFYEWLVHSEREMKSLQKIIEQSKTETSKKVREETMLRNVIKSLEQGIRKGEVAAKKDIKAVQEEAIKLIETSDLEANDRAKFIRTIKNIQTEDQLQKAIPEIEGRIQKLEEAAKTQELISDIKKLPTKSLPLEYKDMIEKLKAPFDLKKRTEKTLLQRGESKKFFDKLMEQGVELSEDQKEVLSEAEKIPLNELKFEELQALHDQIMRLYHQGSLKSKLIKIQKAREIGSYVDEIVAQLKDGMSDVERDTAVRILSEQNSNLVGKSREFIDAYIALHLRPELMYEMAGLDEVFNSMVESDQSKDKGINKVSAEIEEIHKKVDIGKAVHKKYDLGRFKGFSLDYAMFVYANTHNQGNYEHLLGSGFTADEVDAFTKWLEKNHPEAKKAVDDMIAYYDDVQYAELDKVFSRLEGVHLGKQEGYFPIQNLEGVAQDKNIERGILERAYVRKASPDKRFTKERVNSKAAFSKMSYFTSVLRNMNSVQHYIAFAETMRDANRIMSNPKLKEALAAKFGDTWVEQFDKHLKDAAYGGAERYNDAINTFANSLRSNYALAVLGFNLSTVIKQPISWLQGAEYVGKANVVKATAEFLIHPLKTIKFAQDKSELIKNRAFTQEREFIEMMRSAARGKLAGQFGQKQLAEEAKKWSMAMIQASDIATVSIVFKGAYDKAISDNMGEKEATAEAEKAIRRTQPMGGTLYLPTIFRGSDIQKLYTLFKNQPNQNFNLLWESQRKLRKGDISVAKWGMEQFMYAIIPGLVLGLISRKRLPKDLKEFLFDNVNQYLGALFLIGNISNSMASGYWGGLTPMEGIMDDMQRLLTGKKLETKAKGAARVGAALSGIPYIGLERIFTGKPLGGKKEKSKKRRTTSRRNR